MEERKEIVINKLTEDDVVEILLANDKELLRKIYSNMIKSDYIKKKMSKKRQSDRNVLISRHP